MLEHGGCVRCLLAEAGQIAPIGRRPLWEESDEIDHCLQIMDDFALIRPLGKGGMGEVFLARQLTTGRLVAIKRLAPQVDRARVDREAAALAALNHPNIVGIVQRGEHQGCAYLAMDYIEGDNLAERMASAPLPMTEIIRALRSVARALAYAHGKGVLHRDLKPQNILIDPNGDPHLTDFGVAHLDNQPTLTETNAIIGTPSYSAPEQLDPQLGPVSQRTDIYGLGATLYHLLTGNPPFRGETLQQICHQIITVDPISLQRLNPSIPLDLEVICLACLEKSPTRRYQSAGEVADELDRWLENRPILRRPAGARERLQRWSYRHPALAGLSAVTALLTLLGISGILWQWTIAHEANRKLEREISRARRELAEQHFRSGDTPEALRTLSRHLRDQPGDPSAASRLWGAVARRGWALPHSAVQIPDLIAAGLLHPNDVELVLLTAKTVTSPSFDLQIYQGHSGARTFGPSAVGGQNGSWGFSPNGDAFVTLFENRLQIWETKAWSSLSLTPPPAPTLLDFAWHPTQPLFFWGEGSNVLTAQLENLAVKEHHSLRRFSAPTNLTSLSLSLDGNILAIGDARGSVRTWDTRSMELSLQLNTGDSPVRAVAILLSPPRVLATFTRPASLPRPSRRNIEKITGMWEWPSGRPLAFFTNSSLGHASSATNYVILSAGSDVHLIETTRGDRLKAWTNAVSPGFNSDGHYLGLVEDHTRFTWINVETLGPCGDPIRHPWPLELPSFSLKSGKALIPTSRGDATVWNSPQTNTLPSRIGSNVVRFASHPQEPWILVAEGRLLRWIQPPDRERASASLNGSSLSLAIAPHGNWVAAGGSRGRFSLLHGDSLRLSWERTVDTNGIQTLAFSPDGTRLAGGTHSGMFYQWSALGTNPTLVSLDLSQGAPQTYGRHDVHAIRYHPRLSKIAVACGNGLVYLLESGTTNVIHRLPHDDVPVFDVRFSPDGQRFAIASFRGYAQVYETESGRPLGSRLAHDGAVMSVDFSPDGTRLLTASDDERARVWDLTTGHVLSVAKGHRKTVFKALFSPAGDQFLTTSADGSARIWETTSGLPLDEPLPHASPANSFIAWLSPRSIAVLAPGNPVLLYPLPEFQGPAPAWFMTVADSLSGLASRRSSAEELLKLKAELREITNPGPWEAWGQSLLAP
ncbi:MAG: protein kinase [Verrucomicrobiales bacterium]|nr:protein kinase [Verrucomicrobiales bacterium]